MAPKPKRTVVAVRDNDIENLDSNKIVKSLAEYCNFLIGFLEGRVSP